MKYIQINPLDNVAVALTDLKAGERVGDVVLRTDLSRGHKVLLKDLKEGENVIKYGSPIGHVTRDIPAGTPVDHSCIKTNLEGLLDYTWNPVPTDIPAAGERRTFRGFVREDGQVGVRNQIWIIPTVGCVNGVCESIASRLREEMAGQMGSVDAIVAFPHNYGCSQLGNDHENTRTVLADMVHHPNAGGVLVVSLGCENNQLDAFRELVGPVEASRVRMFVCQKVEDEVEYGLQLARELFFHAREDIRIDVPVSKLRVGLKCGGSDGLSGITANPLLGVFSDWIVAQGGTTVLTEVPEMFGAETLLMNRCATRELFDQTVSLINDFKEYFIRQGMPVYENPSPGNKAGGISTLEDKALGCTQKCGRAPVSGVMEYGDRLTANGLNLLSAPGNDLVASTALASCGCHLVLFTTGRGTPFGTFVPTMKIATNPTLASRKPGWVDFNAGQLIEGRTMQELLPEFIDKVLSVASGERARNEENDYREISIFKNGVTL